MSKSTILIVENDRNWIASLTSLFERNFHVVSALEPENAYKSAKDERNNIGIAIVDMSLGSLGGPINTLGLDVLRTLHSMGIPCIAISGFFDKELVREAFLNGKARYVWFKTEPPHELLSYVNRAISEEEEFHLVASESELNRANKVFRWALYASLLAPLSSWIWFSSFFASTLPMPLILIGKIFSQLVITVLLLAIPIAGAASRAILIGVAASIFAEILSLYNSAYTPN